MDDRTQCKTESIKLLKHRIKSLWLGRGKNFLDTKPKALSVKEIISGNSLK